MQQFAPLARSGNGRSVRMENDLGFAYTERKSGEIVITRSGKTVTVLRGAAAKRFKSSLDRVDPQEAMARVTGNYKRGNEPGRDPRERYG